MWLWDEHESLLGPFSFLLLLVLLVTRSPFNACVLTGSFYLLLRLFSFEPVPTCRALQVLKPRDRVSVIAHRGGSHDAPENTLAAIRQVSPPCLAPPAPPGSLDFCPSFRRFPSLLVVAFLPSTPQKIFTEPALEGGGRQALNKHIDETLWDNGKRNEEMG